MITKSVNQKGSLLVLMIILFIITSLGGLFIYQQVAIKPTQSTTLTKISSPTPTLTTTSTPTALPTLLPTPSPSNSTAIKINIVGDQTCIDQTNQALDLLKVKTPDDYHNVVKYIGIIECIEAGSGMSAEENPPRYRVGKLTRDAGTIWYASTIVHDAWHSKLYHDYLDAHLGSLIPDDVWKGKNAEQQCLDVQYNALEKMSADQTTLDYVKNVINTDYWNDSNRYW